jgi:hypothetical protein
MLRLMNKEKMQKEREILGCCKINFGVVVLNFEAYCKINGNRIWSILYIILKRRFCSVKL